MTPHALSRFLGGFGIRSERTRLGTANPVSAYTRRSFEHAWERYGRPVEALEETDPSCTIDTSSTVVSVVSHVSLSLDRVSEEPVVQDRSG